MAFITLQGTLLDPNGSVSIGDELRFTQKSTTGSTLKSAVTLLKLTTLGNYYIDLQYGLVLVEYKDVKNNQFENLGVVTVNQDSAATTLPELLNAIVPPTDAQLLEFQAILADCVTQVTLATTQAVRSETAASISEAFANQLTTTELIASTATFAVDVVLLTSGFTVSGSGSGSWKQTGLTGQTPSQSPAQLGDGLLNDGNGNQWAITGSLITAKSLGAGLGAADDLLALTALIKSNRTILIDKAIYPCSSQLLFNGLSNFSIKAEKGAVINGNHALTILEFRESSNFSIDKLELDGLSTAGGSGNHGLVLYKCDDAEITQVKSTGIANSNILVYTEDVDTRHSNVNLNQCSTDGGQNGQLIVRMDNSFIRGGVAKNVTGSPAIGLQLKNECRESGIIGGSVNGATGVGLSFGQTSVLGVKNSIVNGVTVKDCGGIIDIGNANGNSINNLVGSNLSGTSVIIGGTSKGNVLTGIISDNAINAVVSYRDTASFNEVSIHSKGTTGSVVVSYQSGASNNSTYVLEVEDKTGISALSGLSSDLNASDVGNRTYYKKSGVEAVTTSSAVFVTHNEGYVVDASKITISLDSTPPVSGLFIDSINSTRFRVNFVGSAYTGGVHWSFS